MRDPNVKPINTKSGMVVARGWGERETGEVGHRVQRVSYARQLSPRDLLYSMMTIVNSTVL